MDEEALVDARAADVVDRLGRVEVAAPGVVGRAVLERGLEDQHLGAARQLDDHLGRAHVAGVDDPLAARAR